MPEIRKDPVVDRWVIISEERAARPMTRWAEREKEAEEDSFCPFCEGNETLTPPEVLAFRENGGRPDGPGWRLRVVPNKFPALGMDGGPLVEKNGIYRSVSGVGAHEVIIETPDHARQLADGPPEMVVDLFRAVRMRIEAYREDGRISCVQFFKNHGPEAGASLGHSHSQLIAMPVVSKHIREELFGAERAREKLGRCVYCEIVRRELDNGARVVMENDGFAAVAPFAPRFAYETWIIPKKHAPRFEESAAGLLEDLGAAYMDVVGRINALLDRPPYNMMLHTAPQDGDGYGSYHWHMELMPVLTRVAGFEWGSGFHINSTPPEDAARFLREVSGHGGP
ncbi:MAG: galactose-1-phosphate uridylyltransferase [Candidatus Nitrospinota bacterium M3_3B_026]